MAKQKVVTVSVEESDNVITKYLEEGYTVVAATPIIYYNANIGFSGGWAYAGTYTKSIQYILQEPEVNK